MTVPVPVDQPYGERKKFVEGMAVANQGSPQATPTSQPSQQPRQSLGFDPLLDMQPVEPEQQFAQPSFRERLEESLLSSPNPLMREAARRILGTQ